MAKKVKSATSIEELFEMGYHIELQCIPKRMDTGKGREWHSRYCWKIIIQDEHDLECEWEGFSTAKKCIADLLKTMNKQPMP